MSIMLEATLICNNHDCKNKVQISVYSNGVPVYGLPDGWYSPSIYYGSAPDHFCGECKESVNSR